MLLLLLLFFTLLLLLLGSRCCCCWAGPAEAVGEVLVLSGGLGLLEKPSPFHLGPPSLEVAALEDTWLLIEGAWIELAATLPELR